MARFNQPIYTMNMYLSDQLLTEMNEALETIRINAQDNLQIAEQSYKAVNESLRKLKGHILDNDFRNQDEEIHFFKEVKPVFLKELIYFTELFYIESNKPVASDNIVRDYYFLSLNRIRLFFERNQWLYIYHRTGRTNLDVMFYTREQQAENPLPDLWPEMDGRFSTLYSFKLSKILAFEQLKDYLQLSINRLDRPEQVDKPSSPKKQSTWTDTKAALIELAYAIHSRGSVNHGKDDVKDIITDLEILFNVQVGNFYRTYQSMRIRKKNRTLYLDTLKESLEKRMDEADMNFA